jgi:multidrug efflux pump subunit AcrB
MEAADEIGLAVIATTFTLIAVFLPTAFMSGIAGKFFKQFGWTASFAVFASLMVARMLTPMMAAYMLRALGAHQADGRLMQGYLNLAGWCLRHRLLTVLASGAFFIGSVMLIPLLPTGFIPADDLSQTQVHVELAPGATLQDAVASAEQARQLMKTFRMCAASTPPSVAVRPAPMPFAPQGAAEVRKAVLTIRLQDRAQRPVRKQVTEQQLREALQALPGARTKVGLGGSGEKFILVLVGEDRAHWPKQRRRWKRICAPSPASAISPRPLRWCDLNWQYARSVARRRSWRVNRRHR